MNTLNELNAKIDMLEKAISIIAETGGDYTQNIVYDALHAVGYFKDESEAQND